MIVNNGDFSPRNLIIRLGGRIVIVDWETWNPNSPFHTIYLAHRPARRPGSEARVMPDVAARGLTEPAAGS